MIELGVEDFGNLILGLTINFNWQRRWLDTVRYDVGCSGFELRDMEYGVHCAHRVGEVNHE